ncbi:hypothetical protein AYI69_g769 [Smittium culicis]|uniref:Uncharacterized protein n=1 Tax=Smittium culicis TaxID=133412 RepID=A0A1R1YS66_9FUNG|nr:hypothetical protein AYI69_g769 [Smittium culicis]
MNIQWQSFSGIETRIPILKSFITRPRASAQNEIGEPTPPNSDTDISLRKPDNSQQQKKVLGGFFDFSKKGEQPPTPPSEEYQVKKYPSFNRDKNRPFVFNIPSRDILTPSDSPEYQLKQNPNGTFVAPAKSLGQHPMYRTSMAPPEYNGNNKEYNSPLNEPIFTGWN